MEFSFSPEDNAYRQQVRNVLARELIPQWKGFWGWGKTQEEHDFFGCMAKVWGRLGWLSTGWPTPEGKASSTLMQHLIFVEEVAYHGSPGIDQFGVVILAPCLILYGSDSQKQRYLCPISRGETFWCQSFTEPGSGSDLASLQMKATAVEGGYVLDGQKVFTTEAHHANHCYVLARTDNTGKKQEGITFFLVNLKNPGVTVRVLADLTGLASFNEIFFNQAHVPAADIVGRPGQGWQIATTALGFERSGIRRVAVVARLLDELAAYLREKKASGEDVPTHHRHALADIAVQNAASRLFSYSIGWKQQNNIKLTYEPSITKVFGGETIQRAAVVGMRILGLHGQLNQDSRATQLRGRLEYMYRFSVALSIAGGTSEIQRNIIATRGLGLPTK